MDLSGWVTILVAAVVIWTVLVIALYLAGRALLARELALLLPNLIRLFGGLLRDPRVPLHAKVVLGLASLWLASPIDLIPVAGQLDDVVVASIALRVVLASSEERVVRDHWRGDAATLDRILRIVRLGRRGPPRALP